VVTPDRQNYSAPRGRPCSTRRSTQEDEEKEEEEEEEGEVEGDEGEEEDRFEVESVRKYRYKEGELQYRIKWKGYNGHQNSWEPTSVIDGVGAKSVDEYKRTAPGKSIDSAKKRRRDSDTNSDSV
jgi:hypothetical protein